MSGFVPGRRSDCRGRFAEQGAILDREAAEFPEAVRSRDLGDGRHRCVGMHQCPPCQVHPSHPEVAQGADAEDLLATGPQGALGGADRRTDLGEIDRLVGRDLEEFEEAVDDTRVLPRQPPALGRRAHGEGHDQGVHDPLFHRLGDRRSRERSRVPSWRSRSFEHGVPVACQHRRRRHGQMRVRRAGDLAAGDRFAGGRQIIVAERQ